jgi:predicted permease
MSDGARHSILRALSTDVAQDTRYAIRGFRNTPGLAAVALLTLAIGIGATVAIFTIVNAVLLQPLPFERPDRLVAVDLLAPGIAATSLRQTAHTYVVIAEAESSFEALGAWVPSSAAVTGAGTPERVSTAWLTEDMLRAFRVAPVLGRTFGPGDGEPGGPRVALLDHGFWASRFGSDPGVVGRTFHVDGETTTIVGVLPGGFALPGHDASMYLPMVLQVGPTISFDYRAVGRLADGATIVTANADIDRLLPRAADRFDAISRDDMERVGLRSHVHPLRDVVVGDSGTILWVLLGAVGLVLLIAIANVANLLLVRAEDRDHELAVRAALGATRLRLVRQSILESGLLSVLGGVLGLALAYAGVPLLLRVAPDTLPRAAEIHIDLTVGLFALALMMAATVAFGLVPLRRIGRAGAAIASGGRSTTPKGRARGRNVLVVAEVSLALVLLIGAGLMVRTLVALRSVDPGFAHPGEVLTFRLTIPRSATSSPERIPDAHGRILEALATVPGVTAVGAASGLPLERRSNRNTILARDSDEEPVSGFYKGVVGDYFTAMGIPLVAGRTLTWDDLRERRPVGLVSEGVARRYWGSAAAALGRHIRHDSRDPWREIVGVVGDVHDVALDRDEPGGAYWPIYLEEFVGFPWMVRRSLSYAVHIEGTDPLVVLPAIRQAVWSVDPSLPLADVQTMEDRLHRSTSRTAFVLTLLGVAGAIALVLGAIGTYGVLAHAVTSRRREIGVRMALGAGTRQVRWLVMRYAGGLAVAGVVVGLGAALGLTRFLASVVFAVRVHDPATHATAIAVLLGAALLAGWLPAVRASRVDPNTTLRSD